MEHLSANSRKGREFLPSTKEMILMQMMAPFSYIAIYSYRDTHLHMLFPARFVTDAY